MFKLINKNLIKNLIYNSNKQSIRMSSIDNSNNFLIKSNTIYRKDDKNHLVWVDCEMTGLNIQIDKLLEIAVIITDNDLNELDRLGPLIIKCDQKKLDEMDDWCKTNHKKSGLTEKCLKSNLSVEMVDDQLVNLLNKYSIKGAILAGNSIFFDNLFIRKYLHKTADLLHYRLLDVSSLKILRERWFPELPAFSKELKHEALPDIIESIKELKYYKKNLFKN